MIDPSKKKKIVVADQTNYTMAWSYQKIQESPF
jgi:hypothetical protein